MAIGAVGAVAAAVWLAGAAAPAPAAEERGLWIGPIHLCGINGVIQSGRDRYGLTLLIRVGEDLKERLEAETRRLVGQEMPIRVDGRTLMAPVVNEPITGGVVQLMPASEADVAELRRAAAAPCKAGAGAGGKAG